MKQNNLVASEIWEEEQPALNELESEIDIRCSDLASRRSRAPWGDDKHQWIEKNSAVKQQNKAREEIQFLESISQYPYFGRVDNQ